MNTCLYCGYRSEDLDVIKKHEEELHGCFRDINPRSPNVSSKDRTSNIDEADKLPIIFHRFDVKGTNVKMDVFSYYDDSRSRTIFYTEDLKYKDRVELKIGNDGLLYIPHLQKMREQWKKEHSISNSNKEDVLFKFLEE